MCNTRRLSFKNKNILSRLDKDMYFQNIQHILPFFFLYKLLNNNEMDVLSHEYTISQFKIHI